MEPTKAHLREVILFHFNEGLSVTASTQKICAVYGAETVSERTVRRWHERFRDGDTHVEDKPRSGRPSVDTEPILDIVNANPRLTIDEIGELLNLAHGTVYNHLKDAGYVSRANVWVPHALSDRNMMDRINISSLLLEKDNETPFLKRMITGDEKWILYNNVARGRTWSKQGTVPATAVKQRLTPLKVMLCVWWDWKGIVFYELLPKNETIDSAKYCQQLDRLKEAVAQKRPELARRRGVVFHHDNARPHTSLATCKHLHEFSWDILPHPPYSPDIAPSDYHLFRALQHSLTGQRFNNEDEVKRHLDAFFASKSAEFWKNGIFSLRERWRHVIEQGGTYIID